MSPPLGQGLLLDRISHRYGATAVVDGVTLDIAQGELVALLGPSGCGKTTLLKIIAGFVQQTTGSVIIGGKAVDALPPNRRRVGLVFQNYALFPHMTIAANIAYGLDVMGLKSAEKSARVEEMLALVRMEGMAARYPRQLSGGQQQRVAIARALAVKPGIMLLDEPFAALDKSLRLDMQIEVKRILRSAGTTTILVTHDQEEALSLADRVAVLSKGRLEQFASPTAVYDAPASYFVNTFVGSANVLRGRALAVDGAGVRVALDVGATILAANPARIRSGDTVMVCMRPEAVEIGGEGFGGTVELGLPLGASIVHEIRLEDGSAIKIAATRRSGDMPLSPGTKVKLVARPTGANAYPANT